MNSYGRRKFGLQDRRNASGVTSILVGDLLVAGCGKFTEYDTHRMEDKVGVGTFQDNDATYVGMGISKFQNEGFDWPKLNSNDSDGEINDMAISPEVGCRISDF